MHCDIVVLLTKAIDSPSPHNQKPKNKEKCKYQFRPASLCSIDDLVAATSMHITVVA